MSDKIYNMEESVDLLLDYLLAIPKENDLLVLASHLGMQKNNRDRCTLVTDIVATKEWNTIIESLGINDFRICSICGSLMHQGYCCGMGWKYYCSDECLHTDFTKEEWKKECEEDDQSHWTDWYEHYRINQK